MGWLENLLDNLFMGGDEGKAVDLSSIEEKIPIDKHLEEGKQRSEEARKENKEEEKAEDGLKHVIDGAKLKCDLCTTPEGDLKVNFDTPTIQDKKIATIKEKDMTSLIFKGNCKKSPNSSSPCASVMKLGEWKDTGTSLIQDQPPILLKSTIKCNYGGVAIKISDCGQRAEPEKVDVVGAPVPEVNKDVNGHFYNEDGTFEGKVDKKENIGSVDDVYTCTGKSKKKNKEGKEIEVYDGIKLLKEKGKNIKHEAFIISASTAYAESSIGYGVIDEYELFAIASVHKRNKVAYGVDAPNAIRFRKTTNENRNNTRMIHAIAAEINALKGGKDYSNGAKQWDGAEQTNLPKDADASSDGTTMFKINVMGWDISDELYQKWKTVVSSKFGSKYFNAPQKKYAVSNYGGMKNKDKIRLKSVAQYGLTMFWIEIDVSKPKEK